MALNYLHLGRFPSRDEIGRRPNAFHVRVFDRLRSLLFVCGNGLEKISLAPGRSGPQLGASLFQLERFARGLGLGEGGYGSTSVSLPRRFKDDASLLPTESFPQLEPYTVPYKLIDYV